MERTFSRVIQPTDCDISICTHGDAMWDVVIKIQQHESQERKWKQLVVVIVCM